MVEYDKMKNKIEEVFINLGFQNVTINNMKYLNYKDYYCKVTFLKAWSAFVIESADNIRDAEKGILEDGDLYYTNISESQLLENIKKDIISDYIND